MQVKLQWATPEADKEIMFMARVSNPANQNSENSRLLHYCMEHGHVSPFEMASACLEINTTRDIGRQILRHRSFSFQEFSQRYADVSLINEGEMEFRECRLQDTKNRHNSIEIDTDVDNEELRMIALRWGCMQAALQDAAKKAYKWALEHGIAKELARAVLPEGMTPSRLYMTGNLRSWMHFIQVRTDPSTQKEHRLIAEQVREILRHSFPEVMRAADGTT
jgi:thymidylate synthase (FAD)